MCVMNSIGLQSPHKKKQAGSAKKKKLHSVHDFGTAPLQKPD